MKGCTVEKCTNKHRAKGYCTTHYQHIIKYGKIMVFNCKERKPEIKKPAVLKHRQCCIHDCERKVHAKKMCSIHYMRDRRHDSPSICYVRKKKPASESLMRDEIRYLINASEKECLSLLFREAVGMNEGENCYSID